MRLRARKSGNQLTHCASKRHIFAGTHRSTATSIHVLNEFDEIISFASALKTGFIGPQGSLTWINPP
jgi:selenocysteine lyase/cysteine desulfurase